MKHFAYYFLSKGSIALFVWLLVCCKSEVDQFVPQSAPKSKNIAEVRGNRLAFKDPAAFDIAVGELQNLVTDEQREKWENSYSFTSLRKFNSANPDAPHPVDMKISISYTSLLNKDREVIIGKNIVWFDNGYTYVVPADDEAQLAAAKKDPSAYKGRHKIVSEIISSYADKNRGARKMDGYIPTDGNPDARYQKIWAVNGQTGPWRKTVYEITANRSFLGSDVDTQENVYNFTFDMYLKLEWWSPSNGWQKNAGETRYFVYDISGYALAYQINSYGYYPISVSWNTGTPFYVGQNYDHQRQLAHGTLWDADYDFIVHNLSGNLSSYVQMNNITQTESNYALPSGALWP
ncbi:hypothetical protein GCM10028807_36190 [Spirosoma daeguense]